ncbi:MAG: hypothetical protein E6Q88_15060 [Lysobacteraceae bacterium]|nr:MAG: hypothetical protein E6Q88_15060 [Xanthomonadaceae bacterium]
MLRKLCARGHRLVALAMLAIMTWVPSSVMAQCLYGSVQSRVQINETVAWTQTLSIATGGSFRVGAFKNQSGQFVDPGTATITVVRPDGSSYQTANGTYQTAALSGTYLVRVTCGTLMDTATVTATGGSATYDMLDYMMNDNTGSSINLDTSDRQWQLFRTYFDPQDGRRFYITKNYNGTGATDYEEYVFDETYIYLVRDTSWQSNNWCSGLNTMMELWTGRQNRGVRFPRRVIINTGSSTTWTTPAFDIKGRLEGNGCAFCTSPSAGNGQTWTWRFTHHSSYALNTGQVAQNVIKAELISGPGAGNGEYYLFSKSLGWVGYGETTGAGWWSHYSSVNGAPVVILPPCTGQTGCINYQSYAGNIYHQTGGLVGADWAAWTTAHNAGFMTYGPYDRRWGNGSHRARFRLMIDNRSADNAVVATVDVVTAGGTRLLARRDIRRQEFAGTYLWQDFDLSMVSPSFEELETRVYWHDNAYITHDKTQVCKL